MPPTFISKLVGRFIRITDYRNDGQTRIIRVDRIRDTINDPVKVRTKVDNHITRSRYMLVGEDLEGNIRSFYVGFIRRIDPVADTLTLADKCMTA